MHLGILKKRMHSKEHGTTGPDGLVYCKSCRFSVSQKKFEEKHAKHWIQEKDVAKMCNACHHMFTNLCGYFICTRCLIVSDPTGMHPPEALPTCKFHKYHKFMLTQGHARVACHYCGAFVELERVPIKQESPEEKKVEIKEAKLQEANEEADGGGEEEDEEGYGKEEQEGKRDSDDELLWGNSATKKRKRND